MTEAHDPYTWKVGIWRGFTLVAACLHEHGTRIAAESCQRSVQACLARNIETTIYLAHKAESAYRKVTVA